MTKLAPRPKLLRSPERQRYFEAIATHKDKVAELEKIQDARSRLVTDIIMPAERALAEAKKNLAELKVSAARIAAATFLGDTGASTALADAQAAVDTAAATIEEAELTCTGLDEREREARVEVSRAEQLRSEAFGAVLRAAPEVAALGERFMASRREMERLRQVCLQLGLYLPHRIGADYYGMLDHAELAPNEIKAAWDNALSRLREDPDAELP
jgi:DNA repair exonuclease SbcCD ATPase subunit